jgi:hypothetical protein
LLDEPGEEGNLPFVFHAGGGFRGNLADGGIFLDFGGAGVVDGCFFGVAKRFIDLSQTEFSTATQDGVGGFFDDLLVGFFRLFEGDFGFVPIAEEEACSLGEMHVAGRLQGPKGGGSALALRQLLEHLNGLALVVGAEIKAPILGRGAAFAAEIGRAHQDDQQGTERTDANEAGVRLDRIQLLAEPIGQLVFLKLVTAVGFHGASTRRIEANR